MAGRHISRRVQPHASRAAAPAKSHVRVGQHMQPFLGRDAREVADTKFAVPGGRGLPTLVTRHVNPERHDRDLATGNLEETRHEPRAVLTHRDEAIHMPDLLPDQTDRLLPIWIRQPLDEKFLALQRAADRPLQRPSQRRCQRNEQ